MLNSWSHPECLDTQHHILMAEGGQSPPSALLGPHQKFSSFFYETFCLLYSSLYGRRFLRKCIIMHFSTSLPLTIIVMTKDPTGRIGSKFFEVIFEHKRTNDVRRILISRTVHVLATFERKNTRFWAFPALPRAPYGKCGKKWWYKKCFKCWDLPWDQFSWWSDP